MLKRMRAETGGYFEEVVQSGAWVIKVAILRRFWMD